MLLWCSFWLVRVGPSECGARVREGMDLISCCMSTLDDRRAVDESGGGGRGNGAQRGGGQSHAAWSNLSRGRTMFRLRFVRTFESRISIGRIEICARAVCEMRPE